MLIDVLQENLYSVLKDIKFSIANKTWLDVLDCVRLEAKDGRLHLVVWNLELGSVAQATTGGKISIPSDEPIFVNYEKLTKLVSLMSPERLSMEVIDGKLHLKCGATAATLDLYSPSEDEIPPVPNFPDDYRYDLPAMTFKDMVYAVEPSYAKDDKRPILTSVLFERTAEGDFNMVTADGYMLTIAQPKSSISFDTVLEPFKKTVTAAPLQKMARRINKDTNVVKFDFDYNYAYFDLQRNHVQVAIDQVEGRFPDFQVIIPKHVSTSLESVINEDLTRALKRVEVIDKVCETAFDEGQMTLTAKGDGSSISVDIPGKWYGEPLTISFNTKFMQQLIQPAHKSQEMTLLFDGPKPIQIKWETDNYSVHSVLMPLSS